MDDLLMSEEHAEELAAKRRELCDEFRPVDAIERALLDSIASYIWTKRRIVEWEHGLLNDMERKESERREGNSLFDAWSTVKLLLQHEALSDSALRRAVRDFIRQYRASRNGAR